LRTPLNGIIGFTNLLLESNLTDEQRAWMQTISYCGEDLLNIISDILDFSKFFLTLTLITTLTLIEFFFNIGKMSVDKLQLEDSSFDFHSMMKLTMERVKCQAMTKNLKLDVKISDNIPERLIGDQKRLRQAIIYHYIITILIYYDRYY
jgi:signal transduction histidine kinase